MDVKLCLILREECRLRVSENRVLRKTLGSKRDEVLGEVAKLHNEELMISAVRQYYLVDQSRRKRWAGHVACMGDRGGAYRDLVAESEGRKPFGNPKCR